MHAVAPRTGAEEVTLAEEQLEYKPLTAARYDVQFTEQSPPARALLTRWRLDDRDRELIAGGEDVYLACLTFGDPLQPLIVQVGPQSPTNWLTSEAVPAILLGQIPENNVPPVMDAAEWAEVPPLAAAPEVHLCAIALANRALPDDSRYKLSPAMVKGLRAVGAQLMWPHSALLFEIADVIASYLPPSKE